MTCTGLPVGTDMSERCAEAVVRTTSSSGRTAGPVALLHLLQRNDRGRLFHRTRREIHERHMSGVADKLVAGFVNRVLGSARLGEKNGSTRLLLRVVFACIRLIQCTNALRDFPSKKVCGADSLVSDGTVHYDEKDWGTTTVPLARWFRGCVHPSRAAWPTFP